MNSRWFISLNVPVDTCVKFVANSYGTNVTASAIWKPSILDLRMGSSVTSAANDWAPPARCVSTSPGVIKLKRSLYYGLITNMRCCAGGRPLDELAEIYLKRNDRGGYTCSLCHKTLRDKYGAKDHLECKHFPTYGGYSCNLCGKVMNTRNALTSHYTYCNKQRFT